MLYIFAVSRVHTFYTELVCMCDDTRNGGGGGIVVPPLHRLLTSVYWGSRQPVTLTLLCYRSCCLVEGKTHLKLRDFS